MVKYKSLILKGLYLVILKIHNSIIATNTFVIIRERTDTIYLWNGKLLNGQTFDWHRSAKIISNQKQNHKEHRNVNVAFVLTSLLGLKGSQALSEWIPSVYYCSAVCVLNNNGHINIRISRSRNSTSYQNTIDRNLNADGDELKRNEAISTWKRTLEFLLRTCSHTVSC